MIHRMHKLQSLNNHTDTDECSVDNAGCNQTCVNEVGSYHCECLDGYLLDEDQKRCSGMLIICSLLK